MRSLLSLCVLAVALTGFAQVSPVTFEGVTFDGDESVYLPVKEIGFAMGWPMRSEGKQFFLDEKPVTVPKTLLDGTRLVPIRSFEQWGITVEHDAALQETVLTLGDRIFIVKVSDKRVEVNKAEQRMRAYQGSRLILESRVSTGKKGHTTPNGEFTAGPEKSRMRYSRKYDNAPMPWSIQVHGDIFMHGYRSVPKYPASHGCIRMPLRNGNTAQWMWHWIERGTPIVIANDWKS